MVNVPIPYCKLSVYFLESAFPAVTVLASIRTHSSLSSLFIPLHACYFFLLLLYIFGIKWTAFPYITINPIHDVVPQHCPLPGPWNPSPCNDSAQGAPPQTKLETYLLILQIFRPEAQAPTTFDPCSTAGSIFGTVYMRSVPKVVVWRTIRGKPTRDGWQMQMISSVVMLTAVLFLTSSVLWYLWCLHKDESQGAAQARYMKGKKKIIRSF